MLTVRGASVFRDGACIARGRTRDEHELERALAEQRSRVTESLSEFAENTLRHLRTEGSLLAEGIDFPPLKTRFRDRHALVVARGPGYKRDLRIVRPYIRDFKPVLVGVDGGADALLEAGYTPDVIVGDMDSVSDTALRSRRRDPRSRLPRRTGRRPAPSGWTRSGSRTRSFPRWGSARTSPCCSPSRRAPS